LCAVRTHTRNLAGQRGFDLPQVLLGFGLAPFMLALHRLPRFETHALHLFRQRRHFAINFRRAKVCLNLQSGCVFNRFLNIGRSCIEEPGSKLGQRQTQQYGKNARIHQVPLEIGLLARLCFRVVRLVRVHLLGMGAG
jgi:hypothetical protein